MVRCDGDDDDTQGGKVLSILFQYRALSTHSKVNVNM